ncbi:MAG: UDP-N-acetylmuramoyl-tripeptide--D-alanyl-D-alanine ligase [Clostridia bacterium]|nr:UDP-N-acetylmuramoyl-tripeptide--D-alanyl-D-alanine ligase [Clostridia bacterium]
MKSMSLKEIALAVDGRYYGDESKLGENVTGVTIDSRKIESGYLFVPIKGERVDGHDFIPSVMESGALCTFSEKPLENITHPYILVDSCKQALKDLAEHYRKALGIKVVGITGSVGKTSTKEMIASVLSQKYNVLKTAGNFNNEIGLPLTIFNIRDEHEIAVLEMGISDFGEMHRLTKMAQPDVCVITNIGLCHLENLGDRDGVLKAKTEMFDYMQSGAKIILNGDDDKLITVKETKGSSPKFFGLDSNLDAFADGIRSLSLKGTECNIHLGDKSFTTIIPIPGHHMVYNALAGALVGQELGLTTDEIKAGIEALVPVSGRNNLIETDSLMIIDDCYNANPISTKASLDVLSMADSRRVAVLGDMFELGENEKQLHFGVGEHAAKKNIDLVICIGALSTNTACGAETGSAKVLRFATKAEFLSQAKNILQKGDAVLVKASNGMAFKEIVENLQQLKL